MASTYLVSSESVTEGHPDKVSDQISDSILDAILEQDPHGRVACETLVSTGLVVVAGEITFKGTLDVQKIVRETIKGIGYTDASYAFSHDSCAVLSSLDKQSADIAMGVDEKGKKEQGAGDQGMMYGYATDENRYYMPTPVHLSHRLCERLAKVRKNNTLPYLRPDGKAQVTVEYKDHKPLRVHTVVVSTQHDPSAKTAQIKKDMIEHVIKPVIGDKLMDSKTKIHVNPTGRFVIGGPHGDAGLTGRKIIVDTYGGVGRHGGGAFSGKDPSKVDRSACYAARHIAKNVVAARLAKRCEVQVAYAIGVAKPVSIHVDDFGTGVVSREKLESAIKKVFDMRPAALIDRLKLKRPIYKKTAAYGHFGRNDKDFTWEATDHVKALRKELGLSS